MDEQPYISEVITIIEKKYNPKYGDSRICVCGHTYHRHFDTYDQMYPCGCKYCADGHEFVEQVTKELDG